MKQLNIDTGVEEFCINGHGVLRFNPSDPNLPWAGTWMPWTGN